MLLEILVSLVLLVLGIWVVNRVFPTKVVSTSSGTPSPSAILLQKQVDEMTKRGEVHIYPQSAKCGVSKC